MVVFILPIHPLLALCEVIISVLFWLCIHSLNFALSFIKKANGSRDQGAKYDSMVSL